jgi:hypothetical protein
VPLPKLPKFLFDMDTNTFGKIKVRRLSMGAFSEIIKKMPNYKECSGQDISVICASVLCMLDDEKYIDGSKLTETELINFVEMFLNACPELLNEEDKAVDLPRNESETSIDYFGKVMVAYFDRWNTTMTSIVERSGVVGSVQRLKEEMNRAASFMKVPGSSPALASVMTSTEGIRSALESVQRFSMLNSPAAKMIEEMNYQKKILDDAFPYRALQEVMRQSAPLATVDPHSIRVVSPLEKYPIPAINVTPIGAHFADLKEQMKEDVVKSVGHLKEVVDATKEVVSTLQTGSQSTSRQNKIMIGIAIIALLVSIFGAYMGYLGYKMGKAALEKDSKDVTDATVSDPVGTLKPQFLAMTTPTVKALPFQNKSTATKR